MIQLRHMSDFTALKGINAEPLAASALRSVRGQAVYHLLLQTELGIAIDREIEYADVNSSGVGAPVVGGLLPTGDSCWIWRVDGN